MTATRLSRLRHASRLPRLRARQRGAVAVVFLVTLVITVGGLLAAIDLARIQIAQGRLASALDTGVDSATHRYGSLNRAPATDWRQEIGAWLQRNYPEGFLNSYDIDLQVGAAPCPEDSACVSGKLPLLSAGFFKFLPADLYAERRIGGEDPRPLEIVLAVDAAGDELARATARQLLVLLQGMQDVKVGLVPFSDTVNIVGGDASWNTTRSWLHHRWQTKWPYPSTGQQALAGCVTEHLIRPGESIPTSPPSYLLPGEPGSLSPLFRPFDISVDYTNSSRLSAGRPDNHAVLTAVRPAPPANGVLSASLQGDDRVKLTIMESAVQCMRSPITYLTDDETVLGDVLKSMTSAQRSLLPLGLLWSWRMFSPPWRDAWAESTQPGVGTDPFSEPDRAIVLISAGRNQTLAEPSGDVSELPQVPKGQFRVEYDYTCTHNGCNVPSSGTDVMTIDPEKSNSSHLTISAPPSIVTSLKVVIDNATGGISLQESDLNQYTANLCRAIRQTDTNLDASPDIRLFTVAANKTPSTADQARLEDCASAQQNTNEKNFHIVNNTDMAAQVAAQIFNQLQVRK